MKRHCSAHELPSQPAEPPALLASSKSACSALGFAAAHRAATKDFARQLETSLLKPLAELGAVARRL